MKTMACIGWMLLGAACCAGAAAPAPTDDENQPTVTREENRLIQAAMEVASINAEQALEMLQVQDPDRAGPVLDYAAGNVYFQEDRLAEAADRYRMALEKCPGFRGAIDNLGRVYLLQNQPEKAIELYQEQYSGVSPDPDGLLLLGQALLMADDVVSAESAYRQVLLWRHRDPEAKLGLVKALLWQERFEEGAALLDELLREEPLRTEFWKLRAQADLALDRTDHALRMLELARRLDAADADMLATLGDLLLQNNQPAGASAAYEAAFQTESPSLERMLRAAEGFLLKNNLTEAEHLLTRMEETGAVQQKTCAPERRVALLRLKAELSRRNGKTGQAKEYCESALQIDPLNGRILMTLAELLAETGRLEDAVMTCERAARIKGFEADALIRQARIEVERDRYQRAVELLEAAQVFKEQPHVGRYLEQVRRLAALSSARQPG